MADKTEQAPPAVSSGAQVAETSPVEKQSGATTNVPEPGESSTAGAVQPSQVSHWTELDGEDEFNDDDSALGDNSSSTASLSASILEYRTLHGRRYHASRVETDYWGPNDEHHNESMDLTHQVVTMALGNKLQLAPLPEKITKVLDVGTGTGIWAIDFADLHPDAEVIGLDMSPTQPTWIPPNVKFEVDDITQPWTFADNSVDYIHMRYVLGSFTDWNFVYNEALRVLKPGGWIESLEPSVQIDSDDGTVVPGMAMYDWGPIFREAGVKTGRPLEVVDETTIIPDAARAAGFKRVEVKKIKMPLSGWPKDPQQHQLGIYNHAALDAGLEGYSLYLLTEIMKWSREQALLLTAKFRKELRSKKVHAYQNLQVVYCQKAEDA